MDISDFPRIPLSQLPTPREYLPNPSRELDGPPIDVNRDDCTGITSGGHKTQQLEYLLGDAFDKGADTLVTVGATQLNRVRQTIAVAAKSNLRYEVFKNPPWIMRLLLLNKIPKVIFLQLL
jgi:L-cysteate sulfo-lyase